MPEENMFKLPDEYIEFVSSGKHLNFELFEDYVDDSDLRFRSLSDLNAKVFKMWPDQEMEGDEPINYVPLVADQEALVWFPELKCFGQINKEDGEVFAYQNVSWQQILDKQEVYLAALFGEADDEEIDVYEFVLCSRYEG